jgi:hypothetical protein
MAESSVQVTEGVGKKLHTWNRTITGPGSIEDEFMLPGEFPYATYRVIATSISTGTANDHILQIMAGASLNVRLRYLRVEQAVGATAVAIGSFQVWRLSTAGTGGTAVTPRPMDTADAAAGATGMTLPTVKGTETVQLDTFRIILRQALLATSAQADDIYEYRAGPAEKPIIIPAGAANGLALKVTTAVAGATLDVVAVVVETAFL